MRRRRYNEGVDDIDLGISPPAARPPARRRAAAPPPGQRALDDGALRGTARLAHRIADDLGVAIVDGELPEGSRIREEDVAARHEASRSPVREALALLERRGLVRIQPRRGTYVEPLPLSTIADLFNLRAALLGVAVRYVTRQHDVDALTQLRGLVTEVQAAADRPGVTALDFARLGGQASALMVHHSQAPMLTRLLEDHARCTAWAMVWRKRALDFTTPERRRVCARQLGQLSALVSAGQDRDAEVLQRRMVFESRDRVLAALAELRGQRAPLAQQLHDDEAPAQPVPPPPAPLPRRRPA